MYIEPASQLFTLHDFISVDMTSTCFVKYPYKEALFKPFDVTDAEVQVSDTKKRNRTKYMSASL